MSGEARNEDFEEAIKRKNFSVYPRRGGTSLGPRRLESMSAGELVGYKMRFRHSWGCKTMNVGREENMIIYDEATKIPVKEPNGKTYNPQDGAYDFVRRAYEIKSSEIEEYQQKVVKMFETD